MKRTVSILVALLALYFSAPAQNVPKSRDLAPLADTLSVRMKERTGVDIGLRIKRARKVGNRIDLEFSNSLADYPWRGGDPEWFLSILKEEWPLYCKDFAPGKIYTASYDNLDELVTPSIGNGGNPEEYVLTIPDPNPERRCFVTRVGTPRFGRGLSGRHIALWQSHGRFWNDRDSVWQWQRCALHRTIEDIFTQSFVIPFLIPMLENAGAYVMTPRERDTQWREHVVDNDSSFTAERGDSLRHTGVYSESGHWESAGPGFADLKARYQIGDRPFLMGSYRKAACRRLSNSVVTWTPEMQERGTYAVYVSYASLPQSCRKAHYCVTHLGGSTEFYVDQSKGGGTWIYLGTFEFDKGDKGGVALDNRGENGEIVTADAVRFGGGLGKIERGGTISGLPCHNEGALYSMIWSGVDSTVTQVWDREYTNEFASRGAWAKMMKDEKGIPFDLSLAFHSDAGLTPNDSTIGTLAIYSRLWDGKKDFEDGRSRMVSRLLADFVQTQVVEDIRAGFDPTWNRRGLSDRSYSESRTSGVPGMILELLSHQNFADMKYGLDPSFQFTTSRAVYKGILKTISSFYGVPYTVQPLPVHGMSLTFTRDGLASLEWKPTADTLEPTAVAESYKVYLRKDNGVFNEIADIKECRLEMPIEDGSIYSFKVCAANEGGISFPSETLSIGRPGPGCREVLVVNNFDRVSAPDWRDSPGFAGFGGGLDSGVPWMTDLSYSGECYEFDRSVEYESNDRPGFGASMKDRAGGTVAGNTFDYPAVHGRSLMALGYSFCSMSREAFCEGYRGDATILDLICGKQKRTAIGSGAFPARFPVFPDELKSSLRRWCVGGHRLLLSGCNIGSDERGSGFTESLFNFRCTTSLGTTSGRLGEFSFHSAANPECYCVDAPDGIEPSSRYSEVLLRYTVTNTPGAVGYRGRSYRTVSIGVPIETIISESGRTALMKFSLDYLER